MCAALLLGERLPPMGEVWTISRQNVALAMLTSFGQFAVGGILTLFVLKPFFDSSPLSGAMIEVSYAGGHGTVAGLADLLEQEGASDLVDLGLTLATIGLLSAVVVGTLLVNFAVKSPDISIARFNPTTPDDDYDIDFHQPMPEDPPMDTNRGMTQVSAAAVFIGVSIALAMVMLAALRQFGELINTGLFENFPLFPFTIIGGFVVQLAAVRWDFEWAVNRRAVEGLGGIAVDGIVICAIGTLSLSAVADNIGPLVVLAIGSIVWSVFVLFTIGRKLFDQNWFEYAIAEFGETQGNVATGFMMVDMVDPARVTEVARGYGYRQLITRPLVGGGFISAVSIPFLIEAGLEVFTLAAIALTIALTVLGPSQCACRYRRLVVRNNSKPAKKLHSREKPVERVKCKAATGDARTAHCESARSTQPTLDAIPIVPQDTPVRAGFRPGTRERTE